MNSVNLVNNLIVNRTNGTAVLKEGDSVRVRITEDNGNGKYTGFVAGARVSVTSKNPLVKGQTFTAIVGFKDGKVIITPKESVLNMKEPVSENILSIKDSQNLMQLLNELSLPQNNLSYNLLQQFEQLNMKLDEKLLSKIYNISIKYKGKEKKVVQLLSNLLKKEQQISQEELLNLISIMEKDFDERNDDENKFDYLNKVNNILKGWMILPFEILQTKENENPVSGKGILSFLFDDKEVLKLMNLDCTYKGTDYLFSCSFENKKLKTIRFNEDGMTEAESEKKLLLLNKLFEGKDVEVRCGTREELEGTASSLQKIYCLGKIYG